MNMLKMGIIGLCFIQAAHAKLWENQFIQFELPKDWRCVLEGAEWVCQGDDPENKKEAIIVLAAKYKGEKDTLDSYQAYLQSPKAWKTNQGKELISEVKYAKTISIADHPWVDGFHMSSEVEGYFTRYLATVKEDLGVLVTYSVAKSRYSEYVPMFETLVKSLRVFHRPGGLNAAPANSDLFKNAQIAGELGDDAFLPPEEASKKSQKSGIEALLDDPIVFYGGVGLVAILLLQILRRSKKRK